METILITNDPALARDAQAAGVSRLMVDLESHGKKERQASRSTFISTHQEQDIAMIRQAAPELELIVRVNPWHGDSELEFRCAISDGADMVMLPMITDMVQVTNAAVLCGQKAHLLPLVETEYSMQYFAEIAALEVPELYIGLNDLHLSLGLDFLFEPLAMGLVDNMAAQARTAGKPFGFGGIGRLGGAGELPPEKILGEHVRLGSTCVILSSRFQKDCQLDVQGGRVERLHKALAAMNEHINRLEQRSAEKVEADRLELVETVARLSRAARESRELPRP